MAQELTLEFLKKEEFNIWDKFCQDSEYGTIFHTSTWLLPLFGQLNARLKILLCRNKNNDILGGIAYAEEKKLGLFHFILQPVITPYHGIILKERNTTNNKKLENQRFKVAEKINDYLSSAYQYITYTFKPGYLDVRPFTWEGFNVRVLYTYKAHIAESEKVTESFDSDIRRRIKKAKQKDYFISKGFDKSKIKEFFQLQELTYKRQRHEFPFNLSQFIAFLNSLGSRIVDIYTIYSDSKPVFSQIIIKEETVAYYWLAAGKPDFYSTGLNQLLFEYMINDLSNQGFEHFDFIGANTGTISKYKATYNFPLTPYYSVKKINGGMLKLLFFLKGKNS